MQGKCIKNEKKISVRLYGFFLILYIYPARLCAGYLFFRAQAHIITPAPLDRKLRGSTRLNVKKCLKPIDKCWGGGGYNGCTT